MGSKGHIPSAKQLTAWKTSVGKEAFLSAPLEDLTGHKEQPKEGLFPESLYQYPKKVIIKSLVTSSDCQWDREVEKNSLHRSSWGTSGILTTHNSSIY